MHFKIEIPDEVIQKMISEKLDRLGVSHDQVKSKTINAEDAGEFFQVVLAAAKRPRKDEKVRTGIRFKIQGESVETSINSATKAEASEILKKYGISISKFCNAALEVVIAESKAIEELAQKKKKGRDPNQG